MVQRNGVLLYELEDGSLLPVLAGGDGGGAPAPDPGLVAKQNELLSMQIDLAKKSQQLEPIMLEQAGLKYNEATKAYEYADPALQGNKKEIERLQTERSLKALKGELPVSETLKKELELGQNRLKEKLYRQLGPGYELSTPGQMAQREYDTMATALKEGEQRDMLTTAEALALNRGQSRTTNMQTFENPFVSQARLLEPGSAGIANARQQDNFSRNLQAQANAAAGQERAGYTGAGVGMMGLLGAAAIMSDPDLKADIEPVSDAELLAAVRKVPVKKWRYKADPEQRVHLGGMATDMPPIVSDGKAFDLISYLGMLTGAVRELDKRLPPGLALAG